MELVPGSNGLFVGSINRSIKAVLLTEATLFNMRQNQILMSKVIKHCFSNSCCVELRTYWLFIKLKTYNGKMHLNQRDRHERH
jgi:hypothetical protein